MKNKTKSSIAKNISLKITATLIIAMVLLYVLSFIMVRRSIINETQSKGESICSIFGDLVIRDYAGDCEALRYENNEKALEYARYVCEYYNVDYVYIYYVDAPKGTITYVAVAGKPGSDAEKKNGETVEHVLTEDEQLVYDGKEMFAHTDFDNEYGHELGTLYSTVDYFGNRFMFNVDIPYDIIMGRAYKAFFWMAVSILIIVTLVDVAAYFILKRNISGPAQKISDAMNRYITEGKRHKAKLPVKGKDELAEIASSFNRMQDDIDGYIESINAFTTAQTNRRIEAEVTSRIQKGMLPKEQISVEGCELNAMMQPAREVGGDMYDYLVLDSHRTLVVIADVSGKGFAAAIFMTMTLTLIHQFAKMDLSPDEILRRTNDALSEKNPQLLFTTAFVGIFDSDTREFTYSNAGHNPPYITGKKLISLDGACGTALGLFAGESYITETVKLRSGDTFFMYTDGVVETINEKDEFYGEERLKETLKNFADAPETNPVTYVFERVKHFSGNAEQFDDITMLALTVKKMEELSLDVDIHEFAKIKELILALPLPRPKLLDLCLVAEELFVNICSYAFPDGVPDGEKVDFTLSFSNRVEMRFIDGGMPYNPLENVITAEDYDVENQIGGLGKFISFSIADDACYEYRGNKNTLTLIKNTTEESK